ncbi:MAG: TRAP transporter small permease subunit [Rhizobiales bacterium]|nr:TRAP transporter small permease subunit [Hyphomicrobiales bacterium]
MQFVKWIDRLNWKLASIVSWALLLNAILITFNAFSRKLFSVAWSSAFDMQWHFFAAVVFIMAAYTLQRNEHVRVDLLANRFGERGMAWIDLFGILLVLLPVCAGMLWLSVPKFWEALLAGHTRATRESSSAIPAWIILSFIPFGFALLALQGVAEAVRCLAFLQGAEAARVSKRRLFDEE